MPPIEVDNEKRDLKIQYQSLPPEEENKGATCAAPRAVSTQADTVSLRSTSEARAETTRVLSDAYAQLAFKEARLEIAREAVSLPKAKEALAKKYGRDFAEKLPERIRADQTAVKNEIRNIRAKLPESVAGPFGFPVREVVKLIKQQETVKNEAKSDRCDIARDAAHKLEKVAHTAEAVGKIPPLKVAGEAISMVTAGAAFLINAVCWGLDKSFVNNIYNMVKTLGYAPR